MATPLRVVYVVGSSHSGSTLLALLADENPQVASVGETAVKRRIRRERRASKQRCSCGATLADCVFWRQVFARVAAQGLSFNALEWGNDYRFEHPLLDALFTRETSLPGVRRLRRWASQTLPIFRARTARIDRTNVAFIRAVLEERGAAVFLDTTKLLTRLSHLLTVPDLDVRIIHLVRDVRGFAASAARRGESIHQAAQVWKEDQQAIARALLEVPEERRAVVRYEDLCIDTAATLRRIWSLCGVADINVPSTITATHHHVLGNAMRLRGTISVRLDDDWRTRLQPAEADAVMHFAGTLNRQFGYT